MLRERRLLEAASLSWATVLALGAIGLVGAGCHSSSAGVAGTGGAGGNAHGDAAGDLASDLGSGAAGGGGGATLTDAGTGVGGNGGAGSDASTVGTGGAGAIDAAGDVYGAGCNTLSPGAAVTLVCAPDGGTPPVPTGGTILPGTYRLTALTEYGGCTPAALAQTVAITATTMQTAADSTITGLSYVSGTYVASGTALVETTTCPTAATNNYQFSVDTTASVTTITLISSGSGLVAVFTKQ